MRVILYEDSKAIRDALSMLLDGMFGIELAGAFPNPLNRYQQVGDINADIIKIDMEMPDLDGIQATQAIHAKYPLIKIVIPTVFDDYVQINGEW